MCCHIYQCTPLFAGQVYFPTAAKAAHSDVRNFARICCGSMSSHSTSAQKQSPNTTFGRSHPPHVTWRVYATISDFANVFAKLPSQVSWGRTCGNRQDTVGCIRSHICASVPWRASLSVPCRIGRVPARVNDLLYVIDYLREVYSYGIIIFHIFLLLHRSPERSSPSFQLLVMNPVFLCPAAKVLQFP